MATILKTGKLVGGIVFDSIEDVDTLMKLEGIAAILTDDRGHNVAEFKTLDECIAAAIATHGADVVFVEHGKSSYELVIIN